MTYKKQKLNNLEIQKENANKLRKLEQMYCNDKVDNMLEEISKRKENLINEMIKYAEQNKIPCKWNKDGEPINWEVNLKPIVINNYFFKSIIPISSQEPIYNAEKLGLVFDYYCDLVAEVNNKIGNYPSSLSNFCKFAGITTNTLRNYKNNSTDYNMRIIANKIYDQISDENITLSQLDQVKERITIFKMKSQNELVEKPRTNIRLNLNDSLPNYSAIEEKINKYKKFIDKK